MRVDGLAARPAFAAERDWQPFHTPKNLAMALMVEAAELAEILYVPSRASVLKSKVGAIAHKSASSHKV